MHIHRVILTSFRNTIASETLSFFLFSWVYMQVLV